MKIKILVSTALIDQKEGRSAGLFETVDAPDERAKYLISIGAAEPVGKAAEKKAPEPQITPETQPAGGATVTAETSPETGTPEKKAAPRRAPKSK